MPFVTFSFYNSALRNFLKSRNDITSIIRYIVIFLHIYEERYQVPTVTLWWCSNQRDYIRN